MHEMQLSRKMIDVVIMIDADLSDVIYYKHFILQALSISIENVFSTFCFPVESNQISLARYR